MMKKICTLFVLLLSVSAAIAQNIKGKVSDANSGQGLPGVSVQVVGTNKGASTDTNGNFTINADGKVTLKVSFIGYETQTVPATSGSTINISLKEIATTLGDVVVVGSRSTQIRTAVETVVPVDVITSKDLQLTGQVEPTQQIQFTAPSFVSNRQTVADGTDHIDPASLRGLGPDQVLVLVNGKRRYNTALININGTVGKGSVGTDLNAIPASSIERIEVLRDGASSQYGSDAIAGVINIVLKKDTKTNITTHIGQQYFGDGRTVQLGISKGWALGKKGYINVSADFRDRDSTNRAGDFLGTVFAGTKAADDPLIAANGGWDRANNMHVGNSNATNFGGVVNLGLPVNDKIDFYATLMAGHRNGRGSGFYRYPKQTTQVVKEIYPKGFLPQIESTIDDKSLAFGFNGKSGSGWRWDLSNTYGGNSFRFDVKNSNNASMGASSPKEFYAGTISSAQNTTNLDFSKDLGDKMNLKSFNLALGAEYRMDNFAIKAGEEASWKNYNPALGKVGGAQVFPGYQPSNEVDQWRNVLGAYADVETDISDMLLINVAGRFENYSDFGSAFAGKLAARLKLADAFSIRAAISNGFRAPSIHQFYFNNTSTQFQVINGVSTPQNTLTVRNSDPIAKALGVDDLKAEKSTNFSLGITSKPVDNVTITVDAYQINIKDRIMLAGPYRRSNATVKGILDAANISNEVQTVQAFSNIIDTKTQGIDIIFASSPRISKGSLDLSMAANFNKTEISKVNGTTKVPATADASGNYFFFDRTEQSRITLANPRSKVTAAANYRLNKFGINVRATNFGQVSVWNPNPLLDDTFSGKTTTDLSISYAINKVVRLTVGANNLFDVYPDKQKWFNTPDSDPNKSAYFGNTSDGRFVYSRNATQFGMNGGYYFANLTANF